MLDQNLIINIDRLKKGTELKHKFNMMAPGHFLDLDESEIKFDDQVSVKGETYIVDDQLILHLDFAVTVTSICAICNGSVSSEIQVKDFYHGVDLGELKTPMFDLKPTLREEIILEIPRFAECNGGSCPDRELIKPYLVERK